MSASRQRLPAGGTSPAFTLAARASQWWNQLAIYLPVLLMGLLAMGSYWLVSQAQAPAPVRAPSPVSQAPDYFMHDFALQTWGQAGELKAEIRGSELRHFPATQTIEADGIRLHSVHPEGFTTTATAHRLLSNDAQTWYQLQGDVVIVRQAHVLPDGRRLPRLELQGQSISYQVAEGRLESDLPVQMQRDADRIEAERLRYSKATGQAQLQGRVRATLQAARS